jgi:hypothetical protein
VRPGAAQARDSAGKTASARKEEPMHIRFRRSGGFASLQTPPVEIDSQELPADKAGELERLVAEAGLLDQPAGPPPAAAPSPARDAFQYDISVEHQGRSGALRARDGEMRPEVARLVQWLSRQARG